MTRREGAVNELPISPTASPDFPARMPSAGPGAPAPTGPVCGACGGEAVVNWRRRLTADELAEVVAAAQSRRDELLELADRQLPRPEFMPLPTADDTTRTVYACAAHAISIDAAALIHQATCGAPFAGVHGKTPVHVDRVPRCDCTPEPLSEAETVAAVQDAGTSRLPWHWVSGSV